MDIEKLEKINELKEKGIISEEEFNKMKKELMSETQSHNAKVGASNKNKKEKSLWGYFIECMTTKYACFEGRARRKEYFSFALFLFMCNVMCGFFSGILQYFSGDSSSAGYFLYIILWGVTFLPQLGCTVRRLHDAGFSGLWGVVGCCGSLLYSLLPVLLLLPTVVIGLFVFAVMFFNSDMKENKYGPVPEGVLK